MTAQSWPTGDERLVRRYRRLLLAYSGEYRRRHGTEMITTLLEMAGPGRLRPSAGEAWHLIASGVRQRFRLPSGRPLGVVAAILVALVMAVFGAAAGSLAGARTFTPLPSEAAAMELIKAAVPDPAPEPLGRTHLMSEAGRADSLYLFGPPRAQSRSDTPTWTIEQARTGLTAAGWKITEFTVLPHPNLPLCAAPAGTAEDDPTCLDRYDAKTRTAMLTAERDGLVLKGTAIDSVGGEPGKVWTGGVGGQLIAQRSAAYLPLVVTGALLGALAGWLMAAALAYRMREAQPAAGRSAAAFAGVALAASVPPVWAIALNAVLFAETCSDPRPVFTLYSVFFGAYQGAPAWLLPGCLLAAFVTTAFTVGILVRHTDRNRTAGATEPTAPILG
jgi:hypothetical protein